ncbi:MAG TPA: CoA transferase [Jatrophihabitans sp.]|nr:CoA transferase [Jatrophihabitans sp.]
MNAHGGLLHGYRVLDLTDERGLMAGRILADLGADVVQVEPPGGSRARQAPPASAAGSYVWDTYAANKRGIVADPATGEGRDLIRRLAQQADFFVESLGAGVAAGYGLGWAQLRELNPALVYGTVTAFGHDGPKAGYLDADLVVWAAGGPLQPNRDGDRPPLRISVPQAFLNAAADLAGGMLFAHHSRERTGRGQLVDVSAQAALGLDTLGRVLADSVGDENPEWAAIVSPLKRTDQSGSGTGTSSHLKKWTCIDGLVEFHLAMGAAAGGFTNNFFRWMHDEGQCSDQVGSWDWRQLPALVESGEFDADDMEEVRAATTAFLATKTKDDILQAAIRYRLLCIGISDTHDLADSPQLAARDYFGTIGAGERQRTMPARWATGSIPVTGLRRPAPLVGEHTDEVLTEWLSGDRSVPEILDATGELPLAGLKIADFSWVVAGPVVGRALADFGATVVRVESSRRVETARLMQPFHAGVAGPENSALYGTCNAGKLGVSLDLATEEGRAVARDIARWADVVVESFSPGQVHKWGLDYETLRADNPSVIMVSTSLMGQSGPAAKLAGYGNIGASMSGYQALVGWPDRPPIGPFGPYTDYVGPRFSLVALLAALDHRRRTGEGCYLDVAQSEIGVFFLSPQLADYFDRGTVAMRRGNADEQSAPHGVYPCRPEDGSDRFVAVAVCDDEQWHALAGLLGRSDVAADPRYATAAGRLERAAELDELVAAWTSARDVEKAEALLQEAGVPAHVCASSADWSCDPQLAHRGHLVSLPHPRFGTTTVEGPRYLLSETPGRVTRPAPEFGRDNEYVLRTLLGYDQVRYDALAAAGVLV